jgi:hypothetical protein
MIQSTHATGGIGGALYKERSQIESALKAVVTDLRMVHEKWYAVIYSGHYGAKGKNMALITGVDVGMPTDSEICGAPSVQIAVKIGRALDHILGVCQRWVCNHSTDCQVGGGTAYRIQYADIGVGARW